jgi:hypothetical protein
MRGYFDGRDSLLCGTARRALLDAHVPVIDQPSERRVERIRATKPSAQSPVQIAPRDALDGVNTQPREHVFGVGDHRIGAHAVQSRLSVREQVVAD